MASPPDAPSGGECRPEEHDERPAAPEAVPRWRRWLRFVPALVRSVLVLEAASLAVAVAAGALLGGDGAGESGSGSDLDPADVLVDYLSGRTGLAALQLLRDEQLQQAADSLVTEDFEELGVTDRGAEIRGIVSDVLKARKGGADTAAARLQSQRGRDARAPRVGLGRVGPLRDRSRGSKMAGGKIGSGGSRGGGGSAGASPQQAPAAAAAASAAAVESGSGAAGTAKGVAPGNAGGS